MKIRDVASTLVMSALVFMTVPSLARGYPNKPVRFVVGGPGEPQDVVGRVIAQKMSESFGQRT